MKLIANKSFRRNARICRPGDELSVGRDKAKCLTAFGLAELAPRPLFGKVSIL